MYFEEHPNELETTLNEFFLSDRRASNGKNINMVDATLLLVAELRAIRKEMGTSSKIQEKAILKASENISKSIISLAYGNEDSGLKPLSDEIARKVETLTGRTP